MKDMVGPLVTSVVELQPQVPNQKWVRFKELQSEFPTSVPFEQTGKLMSLLAKFIRGFVPRIDIDNLKISIVCFGILSRK